MKHRINLAWTKNNIPDPVRLALYEWLDFDEVRAITPNFKPSQQVEAEVFLHRCYVRGGVEAIRWVTRNRIVPRRIARSFKKEMKSCA